MGFDVREAVNGAEAIDVCEKWNPHLIWMDIRMPVLDGLEATRRIKAAPYGKDIIIIALTASAFAREMTQSGAGIGALSTVLLPDGSVLVAGGSGAIPAFWSKGSLTGDGVDVAGINRFQDQFLETRSLGERGASAQLTLQSRYLERIESVHTEPSDDGLAAQQ